MRSPGRAVAARAPRRHGRIVVAVERVRRGRAVVAVERVRRGRAVVAVERVRRGRAVVAVEPVRRGRAVLPLTLTRDGRLANRDQLERLAAVAGSATDCWLFCHGWLHDEGEAQQESARFFALLDGVLAPLRERVVPLRVALHWPSKPFADMRRMPGAQATGLWPELEGLRATRSRARSPHCDADVLRDLCATEIPGSPEEEAELDALARQLARSGRHRGALPISLVSALSFWVMKRRAGEVGERFGREWAAPLWRSFSRAPRLHLIGHSFGAKLVTSMVLGGVQPASVTLLLAAFSAFAFAPSIPGYGRPGLYYPVLAQRRVDGPIVVLRSDHDAALGAFCRAITGGGGVDRAGARRPARRAMQAEPHTPAGQRAGAGHTIRPRVGGRAVIVAASALGAVGARGVGAPELDLVAVQQMGIPRHPIVNVDGSAVVKARAFLVGAHRDIFHREVAMLAAMAAGLIVGGPDGARPAPASPLVTR